MPLVRYQNNDCRKCTASRVHNFRDHEIEEKCRQLLEVNQMRIAQARSTTIPHEYIWFEARGNKTDN